MALSKIDTTNMIEDVPQSKIDNNINFRNIIINGDMSIAQRGTSVTGIQSSGYRTVDRFKQTFSGSLVGTWTQAQSTDVPTGQGFATSLRLDCTTADASLAANESLKIQQLIEGQNLQYLKKGTSSAQSLTVSFWVKSNKTGTYICELFDNDNTRQISKSYTISSANTWEKKTITYAGDTSGALGNDNASSLELNWWLVAGSNFSSGTLSTSWTSSTDANRAVGNVDLADNTANDWYITGVQLEAGTTASDFEFLPVDMNLQRCHRYCNATMNYGDGNINGNRLYSSGYGAYGIATMSIPRMRTTPSLSYLISSGAIDLDLSNPSLVSLRDADDDDFVVADILCEAEL